jgi:hypothetical protein
MKKALKNLVLVAILSATGAQAQQPTTQATAPAQFTKGTDYAATLAARELLKMIYNVRDEQIATSVVDVKGSAATVNATLPGFSCDMMLSKDESANKFGWVVQSPSCRKL